MAFNIPGVGVVSYHAGPAACTTCLHDPIHGGIWLRNAHSNMTGTLGCIVNDNNSGRAYMVSNQHVFMPGVVTAPYTKPMIGDPVLQPPFGGEQKIVGYVAKNSGPQNTRFPPNTSTSTIQKLYEQGKIQDFYDSAIATITSKYTYEIPGIGIPTGSAEPRAGMNIIALTGKSGMLRGKVLNPRVTTIGKLPDNSIEVSINVFTSTLPWGPGDSGSAILDVATKRVLGLIYATQTTKYEDGTTVLTHLACKASVIEKAYGINFIGKPGIFNADGTLASSGPQPQPQPGGGLQISPELLLGGAVVGVGAAALIIFTS